MRWRPTTLALLAAGLIAGSVSTAATASAAPSPPLTQLPQPEQAPATDRNLACPSGPGSCMTYRGFVNHVGRDTRQFWAREFRGSGRWRRARQISIPQGRTARSRCEGGLLITARDGPFYCPFGRTIFMPLQGLRALIFPGARSFVPHAFAISYAVAHEWAHHVQNLLGLLHGRPSVLIELQADCLAGVWGYTVWTRQLVTQADIERTLAVTRLVGDPPGTSPASHGSGEQRMSAFLAGYTSGNPGACATR